MNVRTRTAAPRSFLAKTVLAVFISLCFTSQSHAICGAPALVIRATTTVASLPDRRYVFAREEDRTKVWSATSGGLLADVRGTGGAIDPESGIAVIGDEIWNLQQGKRLLTAGLEGKLATIQGLTSDGRFVIIGSSITWRIWDLGDRSLRGTVRLNTSKDPSFVALSSDGTLAAFGLGKRFLTYECKTGRQVAEGALAAVWPFKTSPKGFNSYVGARSVEFQVLWEPENRGYSSPDSRITTLWLIDWENGRRNVFSTQTSPNGLAVRMKGRDAEVYWGVDGGSQSLLRGHAADINQAVFSPDRWSIATGDVNGDVRVWHAVAGKQTGLCSGGSSTLHSLAYSPDAQFLLASDRQEIRIYAVSP